MNNDVLEQWVEHARLESPRESCGLIAIVKGRQRYFRCENLSPEDDQFTISPKDYISVESLGEIVGICHSHPFISPEPSQADLVGCEKTGLPWFIINPDTRKWTETHPSGYKAPLVGRKWVWAITDCWSLTRDWYAEQGITLRDWDRPLTYQEFEANPYFDDSWMETGFTEVSLKEIRKGDAVLMNLESKFINHCGVYLGDQVILHHVRGRLSSRDVFGSMLMQCTKRVLRHYDWQRIV